MPYNSFDTESAEQRSNTLSSLARDIERMAGKSKSMGERAYDKVRSKMAAKYGSYAATDSDWKSKTKVSPRAHSARHPAKAGAGLAITGCRPARALHCATLTVLRGACQPLLQPVLGTLRDGTSAPDLSPHRRSCGLSTRRVPPSLGSPGRSRGAHDCLPIYAKVLGRRARDPALRKSAVCWFRA